MAEPLGVGEYVSADGRDTEAQIIPSEAQSRASSTVGAHSSILFSAQAIPPPSGYFLLSPGWGKSQVHNEAFCMNHLGLWLKCRFQGDGH